jgi:hypothetical protein
MALFPVNAEQPTPKLGHIVGLLSFQFAGAMAFSLLRLLSLSLEIPVVGLLASAVMAVLYAVVAESKVPSSMLSTKYRLSLGLMVSIILSLLGIFSVILYDRAIIESPDPLFAVSVAGLVSLLLYFFAVVVGLGLGAKFMERRRARKSAQVSGFR